MTVEDEEEVGLTHHDDALVCSACELEVVQLLRDLDLLQRIMLSLQPANNAIPRSASQQ